MFEKKQCSTVCVQCTHGIWVVLGMFEILGSVCWQDFTCPPRRLTVRVQMKMPSAQFYQVHEFPNLQILRFKRSNSDLKKKNVNMYEFIRIPPKPCLSFQDAPANPPQALMQAAPLEHLCATTSFVNHKERFIATVYSVYILQYLIFTYIL